MNNTEILLLMLNYQIAIQTIENNKALLTYGLINHTVTQSEYVKYMDENNERAAMLSKKIDELSKTIMNSIGKEE